MAIKVTESYPVEFVSHVSYSLLLIGIHVIAPLSRLATKRPDWPVSLTPTSARKRRFHVPPVQPTFFVSPGDAPAIVTQYVAWMERQFNAFETPRSMYLSIFNSFLVIRCLSQCVGPKNRYFYHIFVSPGNAPWAITLNVIWMVREFDAYKLPRRMCPSNYNRFSDRARYWSKIVIFSYPLAFDAYVGGSSRRNIAIPFGTEREVKVI